MPPGLECYEILQVTQASMLRNALIKALYAISKIKLKRKGSKNVVPTYTNYGSLPEVLGTLRAYWNLALNSHFMFCIGFNFLHI